MAHRHPGGGPFHKKSAHAHDNYQQRRHAALAAAWATERTLAAHPFGACLITWDDDLRAQAAGYLCNDVPGIAALRDYTREQMPDLLLLDAVHSAESTIGHLHELRSQPHTRELPIILLMAAETSPELRVAALDSGADDYVLYPVSEREFIARVAAVLRRCELRQSSRADGVSRGDAILRVAGLELDTAAHRLAVDGTACPLRASEFRLLRCFLLHRERVLSRRELLQKVRGSESPIDERAIDVLVRRLRQALAPQGYARFIQTVHGSGYRFSEKAAAP